MKYKYEWTNPQFTVGISKTRKLTDSTPLFRINLSYLKEFISKLPNKSDVIIGVYRNKKTKSIILHSHQVFLAPIGIERNKFDKKIQERREGYFTKRITNQRIS